MGRFGALAIRGAFASGAVGGVICRVATAVDGSVIAAVPKTIPQQRAIRGRKSAPERLGRPGRLVCTRSGDRNCLSPVRRFIRPGGPEFNRLRGG